MFRGIVHCALLLSFTTKIPRLWTLHAGRKCTGLQMSRLVLFFKRDSGSVSEDARLCASHAAGRLLSSLLPSLTPCQTNSYSTERNSRYVTISPAHQNPLRSASWEMLFSRVHSSHMTSRVRTGLTRLKQINYNGCGIEPIVLCIVIFIYTEFMVLKGYLKCVLKGNG